jgi:multiple sugar transport system substrate-binding protein
MRKKRQRAFLMAVVGAAAVALSTAVGGCGSSGSGSSGSGANGGHVTLNLWAYEGYKDYLPLLKQGFEKKYPNITLEITNIPEEQYTTKLQTAFAAHNPPDLAFIYDRKFLKAGAFAPVDDVVSKFHLDLSGYNKGLIGGKDTVSAEDACSFQGHYYCFGSYTGLSLLFYNRDMFTKAGIPIPAPTDNYTVDQYAQVACQLTKANVGAKWGSAQGDPITWSPWELVVSGDGKKVIADQTALPQVEATAAKMIRDHCSPSLDVLDPWEQGADYFAQKKIAMVITDFQSLFKMDKAGINWGVMKPPAPPGYKSFFNVWTDGIGVTSDSSHKEAAKLLIGYQTTEGQKLRVQQTGDMPASSIVAKQLDWAGKSEGRKEALEIIKTARPNITVPSRWDIAGPLFDAFGFIVDGKDPKSTIADAVPKMQQGLDRAWQTWNQTRAN